MVHRGLHGRERGIAQYMLVHARDEIEKGMGNLEDFVSVPEQAEKMRCLLR